MVQITSVSTGGSDPVDPLAAVVIEKNDSGAELQAITNAFAFGNGTNYSPGQKQLLWQSGNDGGAEYRFSGDQRQCHLLLAAQPPAILSTPHLLAPHTSLRYKMVVYQLEYWLQLRTISSGQPLVTALYENKTGASWRMQHSGFTAGSKLSFCPNLSKTITMARSSGRVAIWCQNVGAVNTTVTVKYYNMDGTYAGYTPSFIVQPYRSSVVNLQRQQQHEFQLARLCACSCRPADCHFEQSDQQRFGRCSDELQWR